MKTWIKLRNFPIFAGVVCLALLLAACGPQPTPAAPAVTQPVSIKVGTLPYLSNAVLKIGVEEGFFSEQGLAVELVAIKTSNDLIPLLLKGDLDAGTTALTPGFFNAVAQGSQLKIVLPLNNLKEQACTTTAIVARKADVDAKIYADPAQWKGAKIAVSTGGGPNALTYMTVQGLRKGGLSLTDLRLETVDLAVQAQALRAGQLDLVAAVEPWVTRLTAQGDIKVLLPGDSLTPDMTASIIVFGARLSTNPDVGRRFATAYLKAVRQYRLGKTPRNVELVAAYTSLEPELVKQVCWADNPQDGHMNVESIMAYQAWLKESKYLDRTLEPKDFIDTSFGEAANKTLEKTTP